MRSTILIRPGNSQTYKVLSQMAATQDSAQQQLTFYEDLYLRPHRRSASMHCRRMQHNTTDKKRNSKRQSSLSTECERKSSPETSANNPLLDSPPSARQLTVAMRHRVAKHTPHVESDDTNNNDYSDYLKLSETAQVVNSGSSITSAKHPEQIYENHPFFSSAGENSFHRPKSDHFYEVIPAQGLQSISKHKNSKCLTDESNYLVSSAAHTNTTSRPERKIVAADLNSEQSATNLRSMRKMGRSADSIRNMQGNKLRAQSAILESKPWVKRRNKPGISNSASCDNITASEVEFGRLLRGFNSLDKENNYYPYTCAAKQRDTQRCDEQKPRPTSTSGVSPKSKSCEVGSNQRSVSNNSVHSLGSVSRSRSNNSVHSMSTASASISSVHSPTSDLRSNYSSFNKILHKHSSSYAGFESAYENVPHLAHKQQAQNGNRSNTQNGGSNYVNIQEYIKPSSDLNYADLDFTLPTPNRKGKRVSSNNIDYTRSTTPTRLTPALSEDNEEDRVEYTVINIAATQAARLACAEQQQYRQRHQHMNGSSK